MKLSFVLPSLNEEESVAKVIGDIQKVTDKQAEIILVDSGVDKTAMIAKQMNATVYKVKQISYGYSVKYGLKKATGDVIFTADCDGTYPMEQIPDFLDQINAGYDLVTGNRFANGRLNIPFLSRLGNFFFRTIIKWLYGIVIYDVTTGMKAIRKEVAHAFEWESNWALPIELVIRPIFKGHRLKEIPIEYYERYGGETKLKHISMGLAYLRCIIKYKYNLNFGEDKL
ncbi:MAG: glycosyltransferase [bacterium]